MLKVHKCVTNETITFLPIHIPKKKPRKTHHMKPHAFGVGLQRFKNIGLHPALLRSANNNTTPCDYDPKSTTCVRKPNIFGWEPWRVALESEEYSKNLGYEHAYLLEYRKFMKTHLGPGSHDINPQCFQKADASPCMDQNFGKQKRTLGHSTISPGPARYSLKRPNFDIPHEGCSLTRTRRFPDENKPWNLSCNRYKVTDLNGLDALKNKVCSLRGPYDLFTGPRDPSNIFNKQRVIRFSPDQYYMWPSEIDNMLHHYSNLNKGKFFKSERFQEKRENYPGPAHYYFRLKKIAPALYPFGITGISVRPIKKWEIAPGPVRYHVHLPKCSNYKKNPSSVFKSKTTRPEYKDAEYNAF